MTGQDHTIEGQDVTIEDVADDVGISVEALRDMIHQQRECQDCGHTWRYTGSADRPTCPSCKGKRTELANDE